MVTLVRVGGTAQVAMVYRHLVEAGETETTRVREPLVPNTSLGVVVVAEMTEMVVMRVVAVAVAVEITLVEVEVEQVMTRPIQPTTLELEVPQYQSVVAVVVQKLLVVLVLQVAILVLLPLVIQQKVEMV